MKNKTNIWMIDCIKAFLIMSVQMIWFLVIELLGLCKEKYLMTVVTIIICNIWGILFYLIDKKMHFKGVVDKG